MIAINALSVEEIRRRLSTRIVGRQLCVFGEVESTNRLLAALAREGAVEGTVVLGDAQTAGRGRRGQPWFSPPGVNLYISALFRPGFGPREALRFSLVASLALTDALRELGLHPAIKWPNDVLVDRKKVAGVLVECATLGNRIDSLILGVGVNVNVDPVALAEALGPAGAGATSLAAAAGHEIERNALAAAYLSRLDAWVQRYQERGPEPILAAWRERDILTGRRVAVRGTDGEIEGRALGVDAEGCLVVEDTLGRRHGILTEEVRLHD